MRLSDNIFVSNLNAVCHIGGFYSIKKSVVWKMGTEIFGQNKFYYIKGGNCRITIKGVDYEGIPGRWFFIPAGIPHSYANDASKPFSKHWMHFDLYPDSIRLFKNMDMPFFVDVPKGSKADRLFKEYERAAQSEKIGDVFSAKGALLNLIAEYVSLASPEATIRMSRDEDVQKVIDYAEMNMEKNITVDELAKVCHLHPTHFIRIFKKKTGETPAKFIQMHKLETAKRLIEETDLPINEVMNRVGIVDAAQFAKKFRSFFGNSPSSYRRDIRGMKKEFYVENQGEKNDVDGRFRGRKILK